MSQHIDMLLIKNCILLMTFTSCCSIGVDYLLAINEDEPSTDSDPDSMTTEAEFRRAGHFKYIATTIKTTTTTTTTTPEMYYEDEEDDSDINLLKQITTQRSVSNISTKKYLEHLARKTTRTRKPIPNALLEYEYHPEEYDYYENETTKAAMKRTGKVNKTNIEFMKLRNYKKNASDDTDIEKQVFDISQNYEPAGYQFQNRYVPVTKNVNTWYVPEKYPCWDLPILYGQLGRKKIVEKVFVITAATLKVVIDTDNSKIPVTSFYETDFNKWCSSSPCFGDHTLCMFSPLYNSKICDGLYKVKVPTIMEQISLVNTINSMRNHVAKGTRDQYPYLPSAMNMKQMLYDYDLERMAEAWLRQCLPGPAPCSSLDENYVTQLECTKYAENCCTKPVPFNKQHREKCTPKLECFIPALTGCIYTWFWSAGSHITETDIKCGHLQAQNYATTQLLWANTYKVGCAYGVRTTGDIRVACNFNPGAPFQLKTKYYCGILAHKDVTHLVKVANILDDSFLMALGINLNHVSTRGPKVSNLNKSKRFTTITPYVTRNWGLLSLKKNYKEGWARMKIGDNRNGTMGLCARLVTRYKFREGKREKCDSDEPVYAIGDPGSDCLETGRKFFALCYEFRDPTPGYRAMAVIAPVALFSLILYDLFSGVMRHVNS